MTLATDNDDLGNVRAFRARQEKALRAASAGQLPRFSVPRSSITEGYATDPLYMREPEVIDVVTAGCKGLRFVDEQPDGAIEAEALIDALRKFLVIVDEVIISGGVVMFEGEGFPALAFEEFIEAILFRAVIVAPIGVAPGAIEIEGRCFFVTSDRDAELLAALLAGEHHIVFRLLAAHFTDPVWTLFQKQKWPGRADLFLSEVRRFRPAVKRYSMTDLGPAMMMSGKDMAAA